MLLMKHHPFLFNIIIKRTAFFAVPILHRIHYRMNHLIDLPTQFPKRIGIIVMILLVYLILVQKHKDVPVGICLGIPSGP